MRSVFVSTGAFLGRIDGPTRCAFWSDEPIEHDFDPSLLIAIDLGRTPSAAANGQISWDAIECDDCIVDGSGAVTGTTLGPQWPEMQLAGGVCLEQGFVARLPERLRPAIPPRLMAGRAYEYTTVLYWPHVAGPRAGMRYTGHHAEIVEERGTLARIALYARGMSTEGVEPALVWLDLVDPEQVDAGPEALTEIGLGAGVKAGALFVASGKFVPVD